MDSKSALSHHAVLVWARSLPTGIEKKKESLEPDSNQRPKDLCIAYYSPPLYQLSYQGNMVKRERTCTRILEK